VTPGQRLGRVGEFVAGPGTYEHERYIRASLVGWKQVTEARTPLARASLALPVLDAALCVSHMITNAVSDVRVLRLLRVRDARMPACRFRCCASCRRSRRC